MYLGVGILWDRVTTLTFLMVKYCCPERDILFLRNHKDIVRSIIMYAAVEWFPNPKLIYRSRLSVYDGITPFQLTRVKGREKVDGKKFRPLFLPGLSRVISTLNLLVVRKHRLAPNSSPTDVVKSPKTERGLYHAWAVAII